jgi:hypothetical protein
MKTGEQRKIGFNAGECIFEPFWDTTISTFKSWTVRDGAAYGLNVHQNWCWVEFEWERKNKDGSELHMEKQTLLTCGGYDALMISAVLPPLSVLCLSARTDKGLLECTCAAYEDGCKEYSLELGGAAEIYGLAIDIFTGGDGRNEVGWINWLGLQNRAALSRVQEETLCWDETWQGYIKPAGTALTFRPELELLVSAGELEQIREAHGRTLLERGTTPILEAAVEARKRTPESMISGFINFWGDTRYNRDRDHGKFLIRNGVAACVAGVLTRDEALMRLAARYALSIAVSRFWDTSMICYFPGGTFEHRSFVQSLCCYDLGLILDLAGELFTDTAKALIRRRIAESGLGQINFITWRHEYIFNCNQLAWFSPGRMMGYAALQSAMPRVNRYFDIAYDELVESTNRTVLSDGGYPEGPTYFTCVGRDTNLSLYIYARARGLDYTGILPEAILRTGRFAEIFFSTDEAQDVIPTCDANAVLSMEYLAFMATALPDSQWVRMYRKAAARTGGPDTLMSMKLDKTIPHTAPEPAHFTMLPEMRIMSSYRKLDGLPVKVLAMGNRAGAGHAHEDKGSFVLEFAGQTFAADPGTCDYSSPFSLLYTQCQYHNMLIPYGMEERPHPDSPVEVNVDIAGGGDETSLEISIPAGRAWSRFFKHWERQIASPNPDTLLITDDYEVDTALGVDFQWITRLEVEQSGQTAVIRGKNGTVRVSFPDDCPLTLKKLPGFGGSGFTAVTARRAGKSGILRVAVQLEPGCGG